MIQGTIKPRLRIRQEVRSVWGYLGLLGLTALLMGLAYPRPGWWPLGYVCLVPMGMLAVRTTTWKRLGWTSFLVFYLWWLVRAQWLIPVTIGGYVALCGLMAAYWALGVVLIQRINHTFPSLMCLTMPAVWVSIEFLRGLTPQGGFAWFNLAHTQAMSSSAQWAGRIAQTADLFGELTITFVVVMTNGLLVDTLTKSRRRKPKLIGNRRFHAPLLIWSITFSSAWWYGNYRLIETNQLPQTTPMRVAVIQTNVPQSNKENPTQQQLDNDWRTLIELTRSAQADLEKPDLLVWPETIVPGALNPEMLKLSPNPYHDQIQALAQSLQTPIFVGSHAYLDWAMFEEEDYVVPMRRFNSAFLYEADGTQSHLRYDKLHLVPFGEYLPWIRAVPFLKRLFIDYISPYPYDYSLSAGRKPVIFHLHHPTSTQDPVRIATAICYEDVVGRLTRRMVYDPAGHKRCDLLVNLTNSAWYSGGSQRIQHLQIASLRSIENRVPLARSVNTGISGFIDSAGRIGPVAVTNDPMQRVARSVQDDMWFDQRSTLYGSVGQVPVACLTVAVGFVAIWSSLRSRRTTFN